MGHEAHLREGEAGEHADGEQGDQALGGPVHRHQEDAGEDRQHHDAGAVHLPVAAHREEVREVVVPGQQAGQDGEPPERGVGRQGQGGGDGQRDHVEDEVSPDGFTHDLAEGGLATAGLDVEAHGQDGEAQEHRPQDQPQHGLGALGPDLARLAEQGHAVGDGLDTR